MEQLNISKNNDTICAISTPAGVGGIAVIRVSGDDTFNIVGKCWKGKDLSQVESHTVHLGKIIDQNQEILDEVVATVFKAPNTFTGEDVIEISCHGSIWIQNQIINTLIANGCRSAEGGEFTRRAFMNGRIDLSQAEAIADVIASSSKASHRIAISQMRGGFSKELSSLREQLLTFVSLIELELDFSEEEVEFANREKLIALATKIKNVIGNLANSFATGNAIKNGFPVAIVGETNVGKSTLLNRLLHDDKALVSDIKGTTRDVIEDTIQLGGLTFRFIDTAGIRETSDTIENMGIERTYKKLNEASIVLWMIDVTQDITNLNNIAQDILPHAEDKHLLVVLNKIDKQDTAKVEEIKQIIKGMSPAIEIIEISAKKDIGVEKLENTLIKTANVSEVDTNAVVITNARHYDALCHAEEAIARALSGLEQQISGDFISQDIRECLHYIGEITGEITTHEILGNIFAKFCVGK